LEIVLLILILIIAAIFISDFFIANKTDKEKD